VTDDPKSVLEALNRALGAAQLPAKHDATAALAYRYAEEIDDDPGSLVKIGPLLLATLDALGLNRTANAIVPPRGKVPADGRAGESHPSGTASLTELRDQARARRSR
jgi:hypothetical protein